LAGRAAPGSPAAGWPQTLPSCGRSVAIRAAAARHEECALHTSTMGTMFSKASMQKLTKATWKVTADSNEAIHSASVVCDEKTCGPKRRVGPFP